MCKEYHCFTLCQYRILAAIDTRNSINYDNFVIIVFSLAFFKRAFRNIVIRNARLIERLVLE